MMGRDSGAILAAASGIEQSYAVPIALMESISIVVRAPHANGFAEPQRKRPESRRGA